MMGQIANPINRITLTEECHAILMSIAKKMENDAGDNTR